MPSKAQAWRVTAFGSFLLLGNLATAGAQLVNERFESLTFPPPGWIVRNQSTTIGTNAQCWNRFTTTPWAPHGGGGHAGANFNCTTGTNTISAWLITPPMAMLNGEQMRFWTRKASVDISPDRLQVLMCVDRAPDSCGAAGSTGSTSTDVGSFTTVLLDINPTLITGVYPTTFTQFTVTFSGFLRANTRADWHSAIS